MLLDLLMPVMDGYATLTEIKADPALDHIPVIMVSAVPELESVVRCIELGATDYLPKPFSAAVLRARLRSSLAAKRLRDVERAQSAQAGGGGGGARVGPARRDRRAPRRGRPGPCRGRGRTVTRRGTT